MVADTILIITTWLCLSRRGLLDGTIGELAFPRVLMRDGEYEFLQITRSPLWILKLERVSGFRYFLYDKIACDLLVAWLTYCRLSCLFVLNIVHLALSLTSVG